VDAFLAAGRKANAIEQEMRKIGVPTKQETILKHLRVCLNNQRPDGRILTDAVVGRSKYDFATSVRDEAQRLLDAGQLKIRSSDGLWAQSLLDKREEKKADRDFLTNLALLLTGTPAPPEIIVGEWSSVDTDQPRQLPG
jgi:SRSO17 transposase